MGDRVYANDPRLPPGPPPANAGRPANVSPRAANGPYIPTSFQSGLGYVGSMLPSWAQPSLVQRVSIISSLFYGSVILFILLLILIVINFTMFPVFSFSPNDSGFIPIPTVSDQQLAFTKGPAASDLSANFVSVPACSYTLGMDVFLSGNFQASNVPRVLLYRSINTKVSPPSTDTSGNIISRFPDSNLIIWIDPMKNDLFASIRTGTGTMQTTPAIENVPIKKTFRLTVVFTQKFIELYINGNLEKSMAFNNPPITAADRAHFFPVISTIGPNVLIANLAFWPRVLTSREARAYGLPISNDAFFTKAAY